MAKGDSFDVMDLLSDDSQYDSMIEDGEEVGQQKQNALSDLNTNINSLSEISLNLESQNGNIVGTE